MFRRQFLKFLGFAPIASVAAAKGLPAIKMPPEVPNPEMDLVEIRLQHSSTGPTIIRSGCAITYDSNGVERVRIGSW